MVTTMQVDLVPILMALTGSIIPGFVGFLLSRSIKSVDASLSDLTKKVDTLTSQDTKIRIELAELRTRVTHLELLVHTRSP